MGAVELLGVSLPVLVPQFFSLVSDCKVSILDDLEVSLVERLVELNAAERV